MSRGRDTSEERLGWIGVATMIVLREEVDDVVAGVVKRVRSASPEPRRAVSVVVESPAYTAFVRRVASIAGNALAGRSERVAEEIVTACDEAIDLVTDGASTDLVRRSIHATTAVALDRVLKHVDSERDHPTGARVRSAVGALNDCEFELLAAFERAVRAVEDDEGTRAQRLRESFLRAVLEGPVRDPLATTRRGERLDLDLTPPLGLVLLVDAASRNSRNSRKSRDPSTPESFEERVQRCARRPDHRLLPPVLVDPDPGEPLCAVLAVPAYRPPLAAEVDEQLTAACDELGLLAVRASAADLAEAPVLHHRLRLHGPLLERCARHVGAFTTLDSLFPYRLVQELTSAETDELLREQVGPLVTTVRHARERVATWKLLVRERLTDPEAAERLGIGISAISKRRRVIEAIRGDLSTGLFRSQTASYAYELWEDDLPPPGDPWWRGEESTGG